MFQNLQMGVNPLKAVSHGDAILKDLPITGASKLFPHLNDLEATRALADEMYKHGIAGSAATAVRDFTGASGDAAAQLAGKIPGMNPVRSLGEIAKDYVPRNLANANPLNTETFSPITAGREVLNKVHEGNRAGGYVALRMGGYTPEAAAQQVLKHHYDLGNLTSFESKVMKKLVPFYSFAKQNIPAQARQIMEHPGGLTAQAIHGEESLRDKSKFTPDYLGQGMAAPIGEEQGGMQRFLTKLDLPFEQLNLINPSLKRTLGNIGGQLNPLVKAPIEAATGTQLYSGRHMEDLSSAGLTGNKWIDPLIMGSPAARYATSARTAMDPRKELWAKGLNLGTGIKLTDVDVQKAKLEAARDAVSQNLQDPNVKRFMSLYVRPEDMGNLTSDQLKQLQLNKNIENQSQALSKYRQQIGYYNNQPGT
jgi:hypothetical protein